MPTKTVTVDSLYAEYANRIADAIGLDITDYTTTATGLASLLFDASDNFGPTDQTGQVLADTAADLDAIARLGDGGPKTQELLKSIDTALYNAVDDLEMC